MERHGDAPIQGVTEDSRRVLPGWLFAAVRGSHRDGHDSARAAVSGGASALLVQRWLDMEVPQLKVGSTRIALGPVAAAVHENPSEQLSLVGVTGTNGKTTLSYLLAAACNSGGRRTGLVGTVETRFGDRSAPSTVTTPPAPELQHTLASMRDEGADTVVMEVSSHALDQHRVAGCQFALSVFTNLEAEHLDYHGTIEQYYASKAMLFDPSLSRRGIICTDNDWGRRLAAQTSVPVMTYSEEPGSDVQYESTLLGLQGIVVRFRQDGHPVELHSNLVGGYNAANVVGAYLAAVCLGVDPDDASAGIAACDRPPGRFELVDAGQPFVVVVDYAHTPRALELALAATRRVARGRTLLVVGARGGRDRYKRPDIARVAAGADWTVITTDNPGDEDPTLILGQLKAGLLGCDAHNVTFETDRGSAIAMAVAEARPGDAVLIVGRGHEKTVRVGNLVMTFDDRQAALSGLHHLGYWGVTHRSCTGRR